MRKIDVVTLSKMAEKKSIEVLGLDRHKTTMQGWTEAEALSKLESVVGEDVCVVNVEDDWVIQCTVFEKDNPFM